MTAMSRYSEYRKEVRIKSHQRLSEITIPVEVMAILDWEQGDTVVMEIQGEGLVVSKKEKPLDREEGEEYSTRTTRRRVPQL
jgi:bifunctional DNA-binding transcriptional regulator/antitoxin component of YhaV-PrlF toxin-antitoxin module